MQKRNGNILYSASDLANFLVCEHLTALDRVDLETPLPRRKDDAEAILLMSKGIAHEKAYLEHLKCHSSNVVEISPAKDDLNSGVEETMAAFRSGTDIIYQAVLADDRFIGHADFLRRVPSSSVFGDYSYEVIDTKLSRSPKAKYIIQLCFYSDLLARIQQTPPAMMYLHYGDRREEGFRFADYSRYFRSLKTRFVARIEDPLNETYPQECEHCELCRWRDLCKERWLRDDHLNQVAGIGRIQIKKLNDVGIETLEQLARLKGDTKIRGMASETLFRIHRQAALQFEKRTKGNNCLEMLPLDPERKRGFARLPKPDKGDLFLDLEGDPWEEDGLEYLFGVYYFEGKTPVFKPIWGHTRSEEKAAFEGFIDFATDRLGRYPGAHIYHYGGYEESALKKLMCFHGVREAEVDNLLRLEKLVDLYKVVREGLRISEPRYSLKNVENFYLDGRTGEVKDAGTSIVYYDRWKETGNQEFLDKIEAYNRDDVRSTHELREWLLTLRPKDLPWGNSREAGGMDPNITALNEFEARLARYRELLLRECPDNREEWDSEDDFRELTSHLLDFHRRADKPVWWALFSRQEMSDEDLIDDVEAIGAMKQDPGRSPFPNKSSIVYTYSYPDQETKLKTGDNCVLTSTLGSIQNLEIDETANTVTFSCPAKKGQLPETMSIGRGGPLLTNTLKEALFRFADSLIVGDRKYPALESILKQELPRFKGKKPKSAIIDGSWEAMGQIIEAISRLDQGCLFIQGPPGTGKTYTGSYIIVDLLRRGYRIGVSSNSHKAINNLLSAVEKAAVEKKVKFRGVKKSTSNTETQFNGKFIVDFFRNADILSGNWPLIAGTAWLFSVMDQSLDYLFVDEAGQVALANLIAMGGAAKNIVLLGDQMQLGQPIQGVHPGRSGESSLDYLLNGIATIPPDRGIFLETTWRMHQEVCRFISDAVYDGRLKSHESNNTQRLILKRKAHPALRPTGIRFVPVVHDACSQRSQEEARVIAELFESLLKQEYLDKKGVKAPLTFKNILVVAPYNMQVNLLKRVLPKEARVGTVDKFQGQEGEVVIISMTTSSGDYLPRHIEFLFSKNRLNVAISRAKCLAILVANPALMAIQCRTVDQMALVNTLCWVKEYSDYFINQN